MRRSLAPILIVAVVIILAAAWWFYGGLGSFVQNTYFNNPAQLAQIVHPLSGTLVSQTSSTVTIQHNGKEETYPLNSAASVASRTSAGSSGRYLRDIQPGATLLFLPATTTPPSIAGMILFEPYPTPLKGEKMLTGYISEYTNGAFVLVGPNGTKTDVDASHAEVFSITTSGRTAPSLSATKTGTSLNILGTQNGDTFVARIIDIL